MTSLRALLPASLLSLSSLLLAGCGLGVVAPVTPVAATPSAGSAIAGKVMGGQQPVSGATIQLYAVGTSADGAASTPLIASSVTTNATGGFSITGLYTCPSASSLVYIVALQGNPGLGSSQSNSQLALMAALGPCGNLSASTYINIDEVTTVAGLAALAPFTTSIVNIGSGSADASNLASAFTLATEFASTSAGTSPGTLPNGTSAPNTLINTLADIISACVNSGGGSAGDGSPCGQLFVAATPSGSSAPTNTAAALSAIFANPTFNTTAIFNLSPPSPPFQPSLNSAPSSYAVALTPGFSLSASAVTFGPTSVDGYAASQTVTLTNTGTPALALTSLSASGSGATSFTSAANCPATILPGAACTIMVGFDPQAAGVLTATLSVNNLSSISLSGSGVMDGSLPPPAAQPTRVYGVVRSGDTQPIAGAKITAYSAGSSAATLATTTSGVDGSFYFYQTGSPSFSCSTSNPYIYLVATGGSAGAGTNNQLSLISFLGTCTSLTTAVINEGTTAAAVSALAPYMSGTSANFAVTYTSSTAAGAQTAVNNALSLINPATGAIPGTLPTGYTIETTKLDTVADILSTCVLTTGGSAGDGSACGNLLTATTPTVNVNTTGTAATDVLTAAVNIGKFYTPNNNALFALLPSSGPYGPTLTSVPGDFIANVLPPTVAPTFTVAAGTYSTSQTISMTSTTNGAEIYYTTDGSTPTINSTPYLNPITLNTSTTIQAVALEYGFSVSPASTASYTINTPYIILSVPNAVVPQSTSTVQTGTITLTTPAPAGGLSVTVTSGAPLAIKPTATNFNLAAGATSVPFSFTATSVGSVLLTATASGYGPGILRVRSSRLNSIGAVTTKTPIVGFTTEGQEGFVQSNSPQTTYPDNTMSEINADPNLFNAAITEGVLSQLEPNPGSFDFSSLEVGINAVATYNSQNHTPTVVNKFRIFAAANVPQWLLNEEGGGAVVGAANNNTGYETVPLYWSAQYNTQWHALMAAMAAEYDSRADLQEMVASACTSTTDEPFIEDETYMATGEGSNPSDTALGRTDVAYRTCLENEAAYMAEWTVTPLYIPYNAPRFLSTGAPVSQFGFVAEQMNTWFNILGPRAIIANQDLQPISGINGSPSETVVFNNFIVMHNRGAHIAVQEATQSQYDSDCTRSPSNTDDSNCYNAATSLIPTYFIGEVEIEQTSNVPTPHQGQALLPYATLMSEYALYY